MKRRMNKVLGLILAVIFFASSGNISAIASVRSKTDEAGIRQTANEDNSRLFDYNITSDNVNAEENNIADSVTEDDNNVEENAASVDNDTDDVHVENENSIEERIIEETENSSEETDIVGEADAEWYKSFYYDTYEESGADGLCSQ